MSIVLIFVSFIFLLIRIFMRAFPSGGSAGEGKVLTIGTVAIPAPPAPPAPDETILPAIFERAENELPDGLYLQRTYFAWRDLTITGSVRANLNEIEVAVFDLTYRSEENHKLGQTVAAFHRQGPLAGADAPTNPEDGSVFEIAGDWIIYYAEGRVIANSRLESWIRQACDLAVQSAKPALVQAGADITASTVQ